MAEQKIWLIYTTATFTRSHELENTTGY